MPRSQFVAPPSPPEGHPAQADPGVPGAPLPLGLQRARDPRRRVVVALAVLLVVATVLVSLLDEPFLAASHAGRLGVGYVAQVLGEHVAALLSLVSGRGGGYYAFLLTAAVVAALAGMALGASGAVYQSALKNALASPTTLGIVSGGQVGMVVHILLTTSADYTNGATTAAEVAEYLAALDPLRYVWLVEGRALCCIVGCFAAAGVVVAVARVAGKGRTSKVALIVTGQVIASLAGTVVLVVRYYLEQTDAGAQATAISTMNQGSIPFTPLALLLMGVPVVVGLVVVLLLARRMNLLAFGEEEARSMGIETRRLQAVAVALCTLLTAVVISFCGVIGFVGFIVPHLARRLVGPDLVYLLPASICLGGLFVLVGMFIVNLGALDGALRLGLITNVFGAVVFVVTALRGRRSGRADWM